MKNNAIEKRKVPMLRPVFNTAYIAMHHTQKKAKNERVEHSLCTQKGDKKRDKMQFTARPPSRLFMGNKLSTAKASERFLKYTASGVPAFRKATAQTIFIKGPDKDTNNSSE